ncbi:MAG: thioesterase [Bacteroidetes bacterium MED-G13]|nr:thioesterase [Flavobacteriaceae bacterium]PDH47945.1 MAG: thioesterase [Bacteroidetes bacterium MED-G13]
MKKTLIKIKVRYCETDQMGIVHHSSYINYFEHSRIQWIKKNGFSYKELELSGLILPVSKLNVSYLSPAFFDDELTIETELMEVPSSKLIFDYLVFRNNIVITKAQTILAFVNKVSKKPMKCPKEIYNKVSSLFL